MITIDKNKVTSQELLELVMLARGNGAEDNISTSTLEFWKDGVNTSDELIYKVCLLLNNVGMDAIVTTGGHVEDDEITLKLRMMRKGEIVEYHRGYLALDASREYDIMRRRYVARVMADSGSVYLYQRKLSDGDYLYYAKGR